MTGMKFICIYRSYREMFRHYTERQVGRLVLNMMDYVDTGKEPQCTGADLHLWAAIKFRLDQDLREYENRAEQSRINGVKGGRPRKKKEPSVDVTGAVFSKPKKAIEKEKEKEKETEKKKEMENENERAIEIVKEIEMEMENDEYFTGTLDL